LLPKDDQELIWLKFFVMTISTIEISNVIFEQRTVIKYSFSTKQASWRRSADGFEMDR
jgi:hypothetical protein